MGEKTTLHQALVAGDTAMLIILAKFLLLKQIPVAVTVFTRCMQEPQMVQTTVEENIRTVTILILLGPIQEIQEPIPTTPALFKRSNREKIILVQPEHRAEPAPM
jgi:hypothetical protein